TISGHSTITFKNEAGNYGVRVQNGVTANLTDVTIRGEGSGAGSKGVIMESSGTMTMTNVGISDVDKGVLMNGAGEVTLNMDNVQISDVAMGVEAMGGTLTINGNSTIVFKNEAGNYGVRVGELVTSATLTDVRIEGGGSGQGTGVIMGGKMLKMTNVDVLNVGVGVEAKKGGTLTIKDGSIGFKKDYGIGVWGKATATITGTTIRGEGSGKGVYATGVGKLTLTMTGVNISNVAM
ncbi:hypothetical protein, partial [Bartonella bovis]|uniref:hypothetical protein n=1 Tax=Bartonella bovis TaxID=155194 RepID=UPI001304ABAD